MNPIHVNADSHYTDCLCHWGWKRPLEPGQFRLSTLMWVITICCVLFALARWPVQFAILEGKIHDLGGTIIENDERIEIDLSGAAIKNDDLAILLRVPNLVELDLSETQIDDQSLRYLKRLRALSRIDLTNTNMTPEGLAELEAACPDLLMEEISMHGGSVLSWSRSW